MASVLPLVVLLLGYAGERAWRAGEVLRGVRVAGVDLAGLDRTAVARALQSRAAELGAAAITVRVADRSFELRPGAVGFAPKLAEATAAALAAGRRHGLLANFGWWLARFTGPEEVPLAATLDTAKLEQTVATWEREAIADGPHEGTVAVRDGRIVADYPHAGRAVSRSGLDRLLLDLLGGSGRGTVTLPLETVEPRRSRELVDAAAARARTLCAGPAVLTAELPVDSDDESAPGPGTPTPDERRRAANSRLGRGDGREDDLLAQPARVELAATRADLLAALRSRSGPGDPPTVELYFDPAVVDRLLTPIRPRIDRPARDASFAVDARHRIRIVPSRPGRAIEAAPVAARLLEVAGSTTRRGLLPVETTGQPAFTTAQAEALRITKLVGEFSTQHACCQPRVKNIHRIAELVDGTIVRPGETFSLNALVGPRTLQKGFVRAPGIEEGEMVDSVGGGISQFATTLFNAVLYGGYEVVERAPHTWFFRRYPMGFDATLSYPTPDFVFRNDSEAGVLVKAVASPTTITVRLYGDSGGRKVETKKSHPLDLVPPPTRFVPDPSLEPDESETEYRGSVGWSVHVSRTVTNADGTSNTQRRKITYKPRPREVRVHPCKIPKGEEGYTGRPCPEAASGEDPADDASAAERETARRERKKRGASTHDAPFGPNDGDTPEPNAAELIPPELIEPSDS